VYCLVAGIYLSSMAVVLLIFPRTISVLRHFPLLHGLKLASPYFTLLVGVIWTWIGWGLLQLRNWARITASAILGIGVAWLLPPLLQNRVHSLWSELGIILEIVLRSAAAVYLLSSSIVGLFEQSSSAQ
jgi:hypothetical protein